MTVAVALLCGVACTQQPQVEGRPDDAGHATPTASPTPAPQPGTLTFTGRDGWETWDRAAVEAHAPAVAWASTIPFDPTDLAEDAPAIPIATIAELGGDEARDFDHIVVTALTVPSEYDPGVGSGRPTNLQHAAFRMPGPEEPPGDYAVLEIPAPPILVRVYFAVSLHETRVNGLPDNMVDRAQAELDTLQITPGLSGEMTAVAPLGAHRDPRPLRVIETGGQPLPREGLVVARGRDISLLTTDGATIGSLATFGCTTNGRSPDRWSCVAGPRSTFCRCVGACSGPWQIETRRSPCRRSSDRTSVSAVPPVRCPRPVGGRTPCRGRTRSCWRNGRVSVRFRTRCS